MYIKKWNEFIANSYAQEQNIKLTKQHWEIIYLFKNYHKKKKKNNLTKTTFMKQQRYIYKLFPKGITQIYKIAGIYKKANCF